MKKILFGIYNYILYVLHYPVLFIEWNKQNEINERCVEYAFTFKNVHKYGVSKILDIGTGKSSFPHLLSFCGFKVTAIDTDVYNRHFRILKDDITDPKIKGQYQCITCISVLEHIKEHITAIFEMSNLLVPGGILILTVPYNKDFYHENIIKHPEANYNRVPKYITQNYSRNELAEWLKVGHFEITEEEYYKAFTGQYWRFGERIPLTKTSADEPHQMICLVLKKAEPI